MSTKLGNLIQESFEKQFNKGLELGEKLGRHKVLEEQENLQGLLHRDFHKIFRPFCWLFGHTWSPIWCACKICYMSGEEMMQKTKEEPRQMGSRAEIGSTQYEFQTTPRKTKKELGSEGTS